MANWLEPHDLVFVFIGPSGAGRSTIASELVNKKLLAVTPSWTTRPRRAKGTEESVNHRFVDEATFKHQIKIGGFLDHAQLFGGVDWYGQPRPKKTAENQYPLLVLRLEVIDKLFHHFPHPVIYQIEASREVMCRRMAARGQEVADIVRRMAVMDAEIEQGRSVAKRTFTNGGTLESVVESVANAIRLDSITYSCYCSLEA